MPAFDPLTYRYASRRNVIYAKNAVACTSVPLGAQIGLDVMKSGGSAVDAARDHRGRLLLRVVYAQEKEPRLSFPRNKSTPGAEKDCVPGVFHKTGFTEQIKCQLPDKGC